MATDPGTGNRAGPPTVGGRRPKSVQGESAQDRRQLTREGSANLLTGLSSLYGGNQRSEELISQLTQQLEEPEFLIDPQTVREMIRQLERLNHEQVSEVEEGTIGPETRAIDLSRLPPAYRRAIEQYFEKLSEQ